MVKFCRKRTSFFIQSFTKVLHFSFELLNIKIQRRAVMHSFPDFDDQIQELAIGALKRDIPTIILTNNLAMPPGVEALEGKILFIRKKSFKGIFYTLSSKWIFYTHGLVWAQYPRLQQEVVNVWHGLPFKKVGVEVGIDLPYCDYLISTSPQTAGLMQRMYGEKLHPVILPFGFPRNDILMSQAKLLSESKFTALTMVWIPTCYASEVGEMRVDGVLQETNLGISRQQLIRLDERCFEMGIRIVLKSHPLTKLNLPDDLRAISFYKGSLRSFYLELAKFDGIITDDSSLAVDYVLTNKPIYLFSTCQISDENSRGFFETPGEMLDLPVYDDIGDLVGAFSQPDLHTVPKTIVHKLHSNSEEKSTDMIWDFLTKCEGNLKQSPSIDHGKSGEKVPKETRFRSERVIRLADQLISASSNYFPLLLAYLLLDAKSASSLFVWLGAFTLVLGINRFVVGDFFLLRYRHNSKLKIYLFLSIPVYGCAVFLAASASGFQMSVDSFSPLVLVMSAGCGVAQDSMRFLQFSRNRNKLPLLSDSVWLAVVGIILASAKLLGEKLNSGILIDSFSLGAVVAFITLFFTNLSNECDVRAIFESKLDFKYSLKLASLPLIGSFTNLVLNAIWYHTGQLQQLSELRGIQLAFIPIGFLVNLQQITWLPRIAREKANSKTDWFSVRLIALMAIPSFILAYALGLTKLGVLNALTCSFFLLLEAITGFVGAQIGLRARARGNVDSYLNSRIYWSVSTIILIVVAAKFHSEVMNSAILFLGTMIGFAIAKGKKMIP